MWIIYTYKQNNAQWKCNERIDAANVVLADSFVAVNAVLGIIKNLS